MSAEDYMPDDLGLGQFDDGYCDYPDYYRRSRYERRIKVAKTCDKCGEGGLYWKMIDGTWKLCKRGEQHKCDFNSRLASYGQITKR